MGIFDNIRNLFCKKKTNYSEYQTISNSVLLSQNFISLNNIHKERRNKSLNNINFTDSSLFKKDKEEEDNENKSEFNNNNNRINYLNSLKTEFLNRKKDHDSFNCTLLCKCDKKTFHSGNTGSTMYYSFISKSLSNKNYNIDNLESILNTSFKNKFDEERANNCNNAFNLNNTLELKEDNCSNLIEATDLKNRLNNNLISNFNTEYEKTQRTKYRYSQKYKKNENDNNSGNSNKDIFSDDDEIKDDQLDSKDSLIKEILKEDSSKSFSTCSINENIINSINSHNKDNNNNNNYYYCEDAQKLNEKVNTKTLNEKEDKENKIKLNNQDEENMNQVYNNEDNVNIKKFNRNEDEENKNKVNSNKDGENKNKLNNNEDDENNTNMMNKDLNDENDNLKNNNKNMEKSDNQINLDSLDHIKNNNNTSFEDVVNQESEDEVLEEDHFPISTEIKDVIKQQILEKVDSSNKILNQLSKEIDKQANFTYVKNTEDEYMIYINKKRNATLNCFNILSNITNNATYHTDNKEKESVKSINSDISANSVIDNSGIKQKILLFKIIFSESTFISYVPAFIDDFVDELINNINCSRQSFISDRSSLKSKANNIQESYADQDNKSTNSKNTKKSKVSNNSKSHNREYILNRYPYSFYLNNSVNQCLNTMNSIKKDVLINRGYLKEQILEYFKNQYNKNLKEIKLKSNKKTIKNIYNNKDVSSLVRRKREYWVFVEKNDNILQQVENEKDNKIDN